MEKIFFDFIQQNSPDGGFLQSVYWWKFQESYGRKTFELEEKDENGDTLIYAYVIAHTLPVVGDYFYVPRGPVLSRNTKHKTRNTSRTQNFFSDLIKLAKENSIGWVRVEPNNVEELRLIKESLPNGLKIKKSPVDVQPREILVLDISAENTIQYQTFPETRGFCESNLKSQISNLKSIFRRILKISENYQQAR